MRSHALAVRPRTSVCWAQPRNPPSRGPACRPALGQSCSHGGPIRGLRFVRNSRRTTCRAPELRVPTLRHPFLPEAQRRGFDRTAGDLQGRIPSLCSSKD
ncbi:hypothetical protein COLSTE_01585 [Collinsella stercoris DSM 13279]|uniref:Uncharacterized protein n=1 Tax=Collinsella stercoris DSM 13279 TaxID=445975 RepID=B6GBX0_9ACTN|nr:hypothetical protein COLSTE_01585 [Collinsella stercoris DSM 13279]